MSVACPLCGQRWENGPETSGQRDAIARILELVSQTSQVSQADICGPSRRPNVADARFVAIALVHRHLRPSIIDLSRWFRKDRSSIRNALSRVRGSQSLQAIADTIYDRLLEEQSDTTLEGLMDRMRRNFG